MHASGYRINGGLGFAVKKPSAVCTFNKTNSFGFSDKRMIPFKKAEIEDLQKIICDERDRLKLAYNTNVIINGEIGTHIGFGSGTAIRLACLEALYLLNGVTFNKDTLIETSVRGGTSGIGIRTYFDGGIIFDLGRKSQDAPKPSSQYHEWFSPTLLLTQAAFPNWEIGICIPKYVLAKTREEEVNFFEHRGFITPQATFETLYHSLYGVFAAIKEQDYMTFCSSLRALQLCAWKKAEREQYGRLLVDIESDLYECGADAVGMSSFGPSLFFLGGELPNIVRKMQSKRSDCVLIETEAANAGREISYA